MDEDGFALDELRYHVRIRAPIALGIGHLEAALIVGHVLEREMLVSLCRSNHSH